MASNSEFVDYVRSNIRLVPDYTLQFVEFARKTNEIASKIDSESLMKVGELTSTPEEVVDLCSLVKKQADYANAFMNSVSSFKPVAFLPSKEEVMGDLDFIKKESTKYSNDLSYRSIISTQNIVMKDVYRDIEFDFGIFKIVMYPERVDLIPAGGNSKRNEQFHPYIIAGTNKLCLGGYLEPYKAAMSSMRYHLAYTLVMQCVKQYGGDRQNGTKDGPQNPIELWVGQICSVCDGSVKTEEVSVCNKTNRAICPACVDTKLCTDDNDGEVYHPDVLKKCKECEAKSSTVIRGKCLKCREKALASA